MRFPKPGSRARPKNCRSPWRSAVGPDALRRAVADVGFPAIVKPASGTGSAGIVVLHDEEELAPAERQLAAMSGCVVERYFGAERLPQAEWLADYVSVESTSGGRGDRRHFGVTLRPPLAPPVRETGSVVSDLLTDEQLQDVLAAADGALDALGVTHLVTHTEVKIRRDGVEVLEVNGRLGGYVEQMTLRRAGASAVRLALGAAVGEPVCAPSVRTDRHLFSLLFPAPLDAVELLRGPGREALARLPGVWRVDAIRPPGPLDPLREGTSGYLCSIWIEADSATRLHANVRYAVRAIAEGCLYRFEDGSISAANAWAEGFAASRPAAAPPDARSGQERESVCSSTRRK
jgi:biotin carboxylase